MAAFARVPRTGGDASEFAQGALAAGGAFSIGHFGRTSRHLLTVVVVCDMFATIGILHEEMIPAHSLREKQRKTERIIMRRKEILTKLSSL